MRNYFLSCLACLLTAFSGCSKSDTSDSAGVKSELTASSPTVSGGAALQACSLLTSEEIQAVQGEPVKEAKETAQAEGSFTISQCFFQLPSYSNSISLTVVQKGSGPAARDAREDWKETFAPAKLQQFETETGKKKPLPQRIADLGDEAFWMGSDMIGALHVLHGNRHITISVGGSGGPTVKIEKSTALAQLILKRL